MVVSSAMLSPHTPNTCLAPVALCTICWKLLCSAALCHAVRLLCLGDGSWREQALLPLSLIASRLHGRVGGAS